MKEAAKEAVQGVGFDLLVVCGFEQWKTKYRDQQRGIEAEIVVRNVVTTI